jgi:hypothetical protein
VAIIFGHHDEGFAIASPTDPQPAYFPVRSPCLRDEENVNPGEGIELVSLLVFYPAELSYDELLGCIWICYYILTSTEVCQNAGLVCLIEDFGGAAVTHLQCEKTRGFSSLPSCYVDVGEASVQWSFVRPLGPQRSTRSRFVP